VVAVAVVDAVEAVAGAVAARVESTASLWDLVRRLALTANPPMATTFPHTKIVWITSRTTRKWRLVIELPTWRAQMPPVATTTETRPMWMNPTPPSRVRRLGPMARMVLPGMASPAGGVAGAAGADGAAMGPKPEVTMLAPPASPSLWLHRPRPRDAENARKRVPPARSRATGAPRRHAR
jgi:hypothetical protein